ncbi:MAG: hypothetical protein J3K34DRAFT_461207 [Monoraphidium minutum]|nr:MAG: hypothetical protein J3K34DRAFT_461207 [Monoraphidium minutum]
MASARRQQQQQREAAPAAADGRRRQQPEGRLRGGWDDWDDVDPPSPQPSAYGRQQQQQQQDASLAPEGRRRQQPEGRRGGGRDHRDDDGDTRAPHKGADCAAAPAPQQRWQREDRKGDPAPRARGAPEAAPEAAQRRGGAAQGRARGRAAAAPEPPKDRPPPQGLSPLAARLAGLKPSQRKIVMRGLGRSGVTFVFAGNLHIRVGVVKSWATTHFGKVVFAEPNTPKRKPCVDIYFNEADAGPRALAAAEAAGGKLKLKRTHVFVEPLDRDWSKGFKLPLPPPKEAAPEAAKAEAPEAAKAEAPEAAKAQAPEKR